MELFEVSKIHLFVIDTKRSKHFTNSDIEQIYSVEERSFWFPCQRTNKKCMASIAHERGSEEKREEVNKMYLKWKQMS